MADGTDGLDITMEHDTRHRFRCNSCGRRFMVECRVAHTGSVRCPACLVDDVAPWLSRGDRVLRFLMLYEAA